MKGVFAVLYTIVNLILAPIHLVTIFANFIGVLSTTVGKLLPEVLGFLPEPFVIMGLALTGVCVIAKIFNR